MKHGLIIMTPEKGSTSLPHTDHTDCQNPRIMKKHKRPIQQRTQTKTKRTPRPKLAKQKQNPETTEPANEQNTQRIKAKWMGGKNWLNNNHI